MAKKNFTKPLRVLLNGLYVGDLYYKSRKRLIFQYSQDWLTRDLNFQISRCLPLREDPFEGDDVFAFFDNLLPDSAILRQRIAARMHAASDQVYDLLTAIGRDCVGALQFVKDEDNLHSLTPRGRRISEHEIAEKLKNLKTSPLAASEEENFRLSIAGAQEKTALLKLKGKWHMPLGSTPTTHILKPQVGHIQPHINFSDSVENEWLCAQIVKEFGIETAKCEIAEFDDIKVLVVERFDRRWVKNRLIRIPQEDFCQALGAPSFEKYQSDGGPGIEQIMEFLNESHNRAVDRASFMKAQIVFLLLAAIDGHAKNFSIKWGPQGFRMTPLYDILSAHPLVQKKALQFERIKMAMAVGTKPHWKVRDIIRRHFVQSAQTVKFDVTEIEILIDETIEQVPLVINRISSTLPKNFPEEVANSIFNGMKKRVSALTKPG